MNLRTWCRHGWMPACLLLLMAITHTDSSETRVVCYYTNWSVYRPGTAKFSPQNINPYLCTHLIYAFGGFTKENSLKPFDKYQDIEKGGYAKFTGLKTYNKNLKTMLAIGGWNEGSSRFSPMVANSDRRKELVKNAVKFLRQNHFDGLDLDWEYPSFRDGGKARDRENYAQLVQELREEFNRESEKTGRPRLLLTMAVPAGIEYINKGYDIPKLTKYLDWMNILSYDYHSAFEPAVNHHSPLYPLEEENEYNFDADLNIDHTIKHYLKMGADPNKLVLGIPTYGRSYTLYNPDANEIGAPADGPGDMGDATRENGYLAFYEICENLKENDWKVVQPNPSAMGPYAYKDNQWVSYDDELIVKKKSEYVVENNLGGIMFWSIDNDDFRGHCYNKPYPLIEAAKEALIAAASGKTETNLVSGSTKPRKPLNSRGRTRPTISSGSKKEESASTGRIQNSGGRQGGDEVSNSSGSRKRIRTGSRNKNRDEETFEHKEVKTQQRNRGRGSGRRRKTTTTAAPTTTTTLRTTSILQQTTPTWKTPEPPTTPDPGGDFKCEEDGFFPHPRDCKKYFWCLSGPADLGIIAHQFTCPAGLYFNKLADSCDYTQNVLCKKNSKTTTTTAPTTSATSTTTTEAPSTTRRPARITAATSRTTFLYTSTTTTEEPEYYDDEYEYEDEEEADNAPRRGEPDSEEDPRVIKELIDLIKKVGGVEELEKYLKLQEDGTMAVTDNAGSTTPATISRSLYERVLSRANAAKTSTSTKTQSRNSLTYAAINRNSRPGPQNAGIDKKENDDESTKSRGRPKYTTITRQRASTEKVIEDNESEDEEIDDEEEVKSTRTRQFPSRKSKQPEYVTIKRSRPTATTDVEEEEAPSRKILRGRQRGVPGEEAEEQENLSDGTQSPEYVTIRRNRPTTEESSTSKYTTIQRRRPATETQDDAETTTGGEFSRRRSTTVAPEDISSTTIETSPSTILSTQDKTETAVETTSSIGDENETVPSSVVVTTETTTDVKSTIENTATESSTIINQDTAQSTTLVQTTKAASSTELPSTSKDKSTNQISENAQTQESSSEKTSPQLFRPRPFATRTRGTTTSKPTTETTEVPVKKVSEQSGIKSSAPSRSFGSFNRKFQAGNRFSTIKGQAQNQNDIVGSNVDNSSQGNKFSSSSDNSNIRVDVVTEDYIEDDEETIKQKEEDFRRRIRNRGRSKFTLPTSTVEPTVARRRRPVVQSVTGEYEYDYEEPQRTYRPSVLADLSSLTSVDIAFQRDNKRKHIRRRPVTTSQVSTTTTTSERPTEPGLKTGPRTLPLARKLISESQFGKNSRRVLPTTRNLEISTATTESSKEINQVTRNSLLLKPRPSFSNLFRTRSTTPQSTDNNSNVEIASNINTSKAPPLLRTTQVNTEENNNDITESSLPEIIDSTSTLPETEETPTQKETDSTESQSEKEYKTIKPDATSSLTTEVNINIDDNVVTTEIFEQSSSITETDEEVSKPTLAIKRKILRPTTTAVPNLAEETSKIEAERTLNRTRKIIIANRRLRTTTVPTTDEKITTNSEIKRQRSTFLTRNLQRQNITRLRPVKTQDDELETNVTSESNRGFVKRIRPADFDKTDDEEKIKLSETNISENIGIVRNLPEDETNKQRRRKIIRRIRPSKDTIYSESKNEDDFETNKRIRLSNKRILEEENNEQDVTRRNRIRNFGSIKTTDNIQQESNIKRIRPFLSKSESTDILRSNNEDNINEDTQTEQENNTEIDEQTTVNNIRHGKELFDEIEEKEISTIETNATEKQNEDDTEQNIDEEITENIGTTYKIKESKQTPSTLYKPTPNTRKIKFLDTFTTSESPNIIRNRNIIRKFRPGLATNNTRNVLVENNRIGNRTRKIIRRLRPSSSTTTESINVATSTVSTTTPTEPTDSTDNDFFTTTENILTTFITEFKNLLPTTEYSNDEITQESVTELEDTENDITTIPTTEQTEQPTTVTTTTSKPRPTRPSLIGRSRPAYRPRNRPQIEIRSTTPTVISPSSFRRRLNKNEATPKPDSQEVEKQETDDGIIDDKLKKLYDKKIKYTPIVRSTTERIKAHEEEEKDKIKEIKNVSTEQEELNTEFNADVTTVTEDTNEKLITDSITTENILDTTIIDGDLTTLVTTENIKQSETTMQVSTDSETKTTMSTTTSEAITTASTTEDFTENVIITTEVVGNTETENPVTEFVTETNIPDFKVDDSVSSTTTEITPETTKVSETTTNFESTSPSSLNENINKSTETDKSYKPIRFKPGDRPKLRIKLNRTDTSESENERNETNEQRNRFTPSRTLAQRNRSKLAYRKETSTEKSDNTGDEKEEPTRTFIPTGRKLERPKFDVNQIKNESPSDSVVESKSERSHYPTLKPVSESFIFNRNQNVDEQLDDDEEGDEEYEEEIIEQEEPKQIENPVIKYLQTIRNNQEIIRVNGANIPQEYADNEDVVEENIEDVPDEEEEEEEIENEEEEEELEDIVEHEKDETLPKANVPIYNAPVLNRPSFNNRPSQIANQPNIPNRVSNRPQYSPKRPVVNKPLPGPQPINRPYINEPPKPISNIPTGSGINIPNRPAPALPSNAGNRNYPRRFNKPVNPTVSSTTPESLAGINIEAVNQRNKNLFIKNRKANIPHPGPAVTSSTASNNELEETLNKTETTTEIPIDISQVTEETILPEPTTEQLSTLHHIFAEPDTTQPSVDVTTSSVDSTTKYNFTAAQIEAARSLERLIEVNRIVEVSLKEDKVNNTSGIIETRVMLEKVPTLDRIGAINRVTVIKVVDGNNETHDTFPSNHAFTLNEIITGKKLDIDSNIDVVAQLHAPDINLTKLNILNNTLEIIKHEKSTTTVEPEIETTASPTTTEQTITQTDLPEKIPEGTVHVVNGPKILDQIINDTVQISTTEKQEKKFEIVGRSNVVDYSHRDLDPIQLIAQARPDPNLSKQGRKLAIDSKSVVANNNRPVFVEATTLPLEALFQTDSPDFNHLKTDVSTQDAITTTGKEVDNDLSDDQDLLESRNHNGRVRIRILGEDLNSYTSLEKAGNPVYAPIRILKDEEIPKPEVVTLKAEVVEVKAKPGVETIRIAPIEVALSNSNVKLPSVRVETSQSISSSSKTSKTKENQNSVPLKRELSTDYFNPVVIFGDTPQSTRPLFFRRPSTYNYRKSTSTTPEPKVSSSRPAGLRPPPRRRFTAPKDAPTPTVSSTSTLRSVIGTETGSSNQVSTTAKPRYKFASRRPFTKKTTTTSTESTSTNANDEENEDENNEDQMIEPSIQRIRPHDQDNTNAINELNKDELNQDDSLELLGDIALTLNPLQKAPLPTQRYRSTTEKNAKNESTSTTQRSRPASFDRLRGRPQRLRISTTTRPQYFTIPTTTSTTTTPVSITYSYNTLRRRRPQPFEKTKYEKVTQVPVQQYTTGSYTPITIEYDYYDEGDVRIIGQLPANSKVLIHATGAIQCLDQGNFPHPVSCKKFISCAKMENGDVIGWEYTCPNRLSFDPVGGMCNWSAGLGCKEV